MESAQDLFDRNGTNFDDVMYIVRSGRKTVVHLQDGNVLGTYAPLKDVVASLPAGDFIHINKSSVVSRRHVVAVEGKSYVMSDGTVLQGRVRTPGEHNKNRESIKLMRRRESNPTFNPGRMFEGMGNFPLPFCIVELLPDVSGRGAELKVRYHNDRFEEMVGMHGIDIVNHSLYDSFENLDRKWFATMSEVALNGGEAVIVERSREVNWMLCCYRPSEGHCGVFFIRNDDAITDAMRDFIGTDGTSLHF